MNTVKFDTDERGVATVTLARPQKRNAMSSEMIAELRAVCENIEDLPSVRVVVLASQGPVFCAGGDLAWMRAQMEADRETRRGEAMKLAEMLLAFNSLSKPVIARVQGDAFGGGVGLLSVCDAVFAVQDARFGLTETRLGLIPATIGPYVVARIGAAAARRYFYSSRVFDCGEARAMGLVSEAVSADGLDAAVGAEVEPYLSCAPGAVSEAKALCRRLSGAVGAAEIEASVDALVKRWDSDEAEAGTAAFFAKTPPPWRR